MHNNSYFSPHRVTLKSKCINGCWRNSGIVKWTQLQSKINVCFKSLLLDYFTRVILKDINKIQIWYYYFVSKIFWIFSIILAIQSVVLKHAGKALCEGASISLSFHWAHVFYITCWNAVLLPCRDFLFCAKSNTTLRFLSYLNCVFTFFVTYVYIQYLFLILTFSLLLSLIA